MKKHRYLHRIDRPHEISDEGCDGIVVGSEYCYFLLPQGEELEMVCELAVSRSLDLTIMIPYLREHQIKTVLNGIRGIKERVRPRLVVNDWGALWVFRKMIPDIEIVLGRMLSGQKSCVRNVNSPFLTEEGRWLLGKDLFSFGKKKDFISSNLGVKSIGVSLTHQKLEDGETEGRVFHFPYVLVTVTDYCPYRNNLPSALIPSCQRFCREGYVVLSDESLGEVIYQRGKGRFFNPFREEFRFSGLNDVEVIVYDEVP